MKNLILTSALSLALSGCTYLESVSTTPIPADRQTKVKAETSRFVILLFNFNNDYVNEMAEDLANQCPNGKVQGILTKHESVVYFPLLFHSIKVSAEGFCVKNHGGKS